MYLGYPVRVVTEPVYSGRHGTHCGVIGAACQIRDVLKIVMKVSGAALLASLAVMIHYMYYRRDRGKEKAWDTTQK